VSPVDARPATPAPGAYRISRSGIDATVGTIVFAAAAVVLALAPWWDADAGLRTKLIPILLYLSLAQMWNLLAGFAGLVSVGQQMFVGVGMYALLSFAEDQGLDPYLSVPLCGLVAVLLSVPVAALAFRLKAGYFAIGTWVIAEVVRLFVNEWGYLGGGTVRGLTPATLGSYSKATRQDVTFWLALALAVGATLVVVAVLRSRVGLALRAVRDSESGARGLGVDATRTKVLVWLIAAFWTGCTGAVILLNTTSTRSDSAFSVSQWTALVIFVVVIGGVGSTTGPIFGVIVYFALDQLLDNADTWRFIVLGTIAALFAVVAPTGLYGLIQKWKPLQFFPVRRTLVARQPQ